MASPLPVCSAPRTRVYTAQVFPGRANLRLSRQRPPRGALQAARAAPSGPPEVLITVEGVSKSHDGIRILFSDLTFTLSRGDRMAIIGANGSGKTSLLRLISGADWPDDGTIDVRKDIKVGFLSQAAELGDGLTALDAVVQSESPIAAAVRNYNRLVAQGDSADRQELNKAMDTMNALEAWELEARAKEVLERVGIPDAAMPVEKMSGGQRRKVTVAAALLGEPDVLVLDEPTNHMSQEFIEWMIETIVSADMTLLLVTHDRAFMEATCTTILELEGGAGYVHEVGGQGSYHRFVQRRDARRKAQAAAAQDAKVVLRKESEWMARQPKARSTKSRARIEAFEELQQKARSGPRVDAAVSFGDVHMARQGNKVIVVKDLMKMWDGRKLIDGFSYEFSPGERLGVVGPNGAGKSTLLDLIAGILPADGGARLEGDTTVIGYFAQHPPEVNPNLKLIDYITDVADQSAATDSVGIEMPPDRMLALLGFPYARHQQRVSSLSGGERRRLHLASVLARKPNFLILDEPTNDLDLATIEVLETLIEVYQGCVLVVSHDRAFMDNVTERMIVMKGDSTISMFDGSYSEYIQDVKAEIAAADEARQAEQKRMRAEAAAERQQAEAGTSASSAEASSEKGQKSMRRLGFREKQEFEQLESLIDKLSTEKDALEQLIAKTAQEGDFAKVTELTDDLGKLTLSIEAKTDRWIELAERFEVAGAV